LGPPVRTQAGFNSRYFGKEFATDKQGDEREPMKNKCTKCGAVRIDKQLGMESTPEEYTANMVEVFSLVRELLHDDGTLWLNLGDSYSSGGRTSQVAPTLRTKGKDAASGKQEYLNNFAVRPGAVAGIKPKDLIGIPWRVAFALQQDGWYLRQDIIWSKPNPMPESVTDRCTKAHEYIFLLSKSGKYYYDNEAIKENTVTFDSNVRDRDTTRLNNVPGRSRMDGLTTNDYEKRNRRSVWEVATAPYSGAHFATYPPALIEPCILAGSRSGDIVLDPFFGSGTTGQVAQQLGRQYIGCELNRDYEALQLKRTAQPGFVYEM
ncbi:MAG: site-specific DNA-methyltransferase, partial [Burkholderiales bacterium]